jgi:hypothetical protein
VSDVDAAMEAARPEKAVVRELWWDLIQEHGDQHDYAASPVYVTLCGAEGRDIQMLIDRGFLGLTEVGSIVPEHSSRVVAIESRPQAILTIKEKFPGLRVIEQPIQNIVAGMDLTNWPQGSYQAVCRGLIINLDLNGSLKAAVHADQIVFPVIRWVEKFALLHATEPALDWFLCLTLNASLDWSEGVVEGVQAFLRENFDTIDNFAEAARAHFGDELFEQVSQGVANLPTLDSDACQRMLMTLVPKRLAHIVSAQGWRVETRRNLRYGGGDTAPMVTWILRFSRDERGFGNPQLVYRDSLDTIHAEVAAIAPDGFLS